jgi:hypothetical protein
MKAVSARFFLSKKKETAFEAQHFQKEHRKIQNKLKTIPKQSEFVRCVRLPFFFVVE